MNSPDDSKSKPRPRRWLGWLRDIALVILVVAVVQWWQSRDLVRDQAPPLVGLLLDGSAVTLSETPAPVLVYFWADWCPVCRFAEDGIDRLAERHSVITVATSSGTPDDVRGYLTEQGLDFPVVTDQAGAIARQWGVFGVPAAFVIDADGAIRHASRGYSSEFGLWLRLWWAGLAG
ncbi:MAG: protein disulfide oxidoreductase [Chromatiaceae bacterium]